MDKEKIIEILEDYEFFVDDDFGCFFFFIVRSNYEYII